MARFPIPKLTLSFIWGLVSVCIVALQGSVEVVRQRNAEDALRMAGSYARLSAEHVSGLLRSADLAMQVTGERVMSSRVLADSASAPRGERHAAVLRDMAASQRQLPGVTGMFVADAAGRLRLSWGEEVRNPAHFERFSSRLRARQVSGLVVSEAFRNGSPDDSRVMLAKPLWLPDGTYLGLVGGMVDIQKLFARFYADLLPLEASAVSVALYGYDGRMLSGFPLVEADVDHPPRQMAVAEMLRRRKDGAQLLIPEDAAGAEGRLFVVQSVGPYPVQLLAAVNESAWLTAAQHYADGVAYACGGLVLLALAFSYAAIRRRRIDGEATALLRATQDSLMAHVAVLDRRGIIVSVNDGWREFAEANAKDFGMPVPGTDVGTNYLDICLEAEGENSAEALAVRQGILDVLEGHLPNFQMIYPCHSPVEQRWFQMMVAPLRTPKGGAVVSHTNITRLVQAEQAVRESEQHFRNLANSGSALIWTSGLDMGCDYFNQPWLDFTGRKLGDELGNGWTASVHPDDLARCMHIYIEAFRQRLPFSMDYRLRRADGDYRWIQDDGTPRYDMHGVFLGYIGHCLDVTERKATEAQMRKLNQAASQSPDSIMITDAKGKIEFVNQAFTAITGFAEHGVLGRNPRFLQSGKTADSVFSRLWQTISEGQVWRGDMTNRRRDGSEFIARSTIAPVRDERGEITHYLAIQRDVTDVQRIEEENRRLSFYDVLTGLPNRTLLLDRMTAVLAQARSRGSQQALLIIDIDRFKTYNDARGHERGDRLLVDIARRLGELLRTEEMLARLSADEFVLLTRHDPTNREVPAHHALALAERIHAGFATPFEVAGEQVGVTASIGIALIPEVDNDNVPEVLRRAESALHRAKEAGGRQTAFFEPRMLELAQRRFQVESELRQGVQQEQLRLYLQSQVSSGGEVVGAEALVRWQHPVRGLLAPALFVPIAEESELIADIDRWMLQAVCQMLAQPEMADSPVRIAVNISPRHFQQAGFVPWLKQLLRVHGTNPARLTLEVTERLLIDNINEVVAKMSLLADMGIHFSLDDFGTGYSSLSYLKRLPINELKIDQSFVQDAPHDSNDAALVETILSVARHLRLNVVAEGVETPAQAAFLNTRASVIQQGFLYSKPEPVANWLARLSTPGSNENIPLHAVQ